MKRNQMLCLLALISLLCVCPGCSNSGGQTDVDTSTKVTMQEENGDEVTQTNESAMSSDDLMELRNTQSKIENDIRTMDGVTDVYVYIDTANSHKSADETSVSISVSLEDNTLLTSEQADNIRAIVKNHVQGDDSANISIIDTNGNIY